MIDACFLDMDGVLADFVKRSLEVHGSALKKSEIDAYVYPVKMGFKDVHDPAFWAPMTFEFWDSLEKCAEADALVRGVMSVFGEDAVGVLTTPALKPGCRDAKAAWIERNYPPLSRRLFMGTAKYLFAAPSKLLVDDNDHVVDAYRARGGPAVLVPRPWNTRRGETDSSGNYNVGLLVDEIRTLSVRSN